MLDEVGQLQPIDQGQANNVLDPAYAQFRDQTRFWIQRVAVPLIMVIGLFGNLITVIIMTRRRMRSTTNMYLAALAFVDMLYLVLTFVLGLSHYPNMVGRRYYFYWRLRPFLMMLTDACSNTSVWLTVTFTIERFIAVKYPMKGKVWCTEARAKKLIVCVFIFGLLFAAPVPFEWKVIEKPVVPMSSSGTPVASGADGSTKASTSGTVAQMVVAQSDGKGPSRSTDINDASSSVSNGSNSSLVTNESHILALDYSDFGRNETYKTIYYWSTAVIFYFIPLLSLTFFNGFLIQSVHRSQRKRNKMTNHQSVMQHNNIKQRQIVRTKSKRPNMQLNECQHDQSKHFTPIMPKILTNAEEARFKASVEQTNDDQYNHNHNNTGSQTTPTTTQRERLRELKLILISCPDQHVETKNARVPLASSVTNLSLTNEVNNCLDSVPLIIEQHYSSGADKQSEHKDESIIGCKSATKFVQLDALNHGASAETNNQTNSKMINENKFNHGEIFRENQDTLCQSDLNVRQDCDKNNLNNVATTLLNQNSTMKQNNTAPVNSRNILAKDCYDTTALNNNRISAEKHLRATSGDPMVAKSIQVLPTVFVDKSGAESVKSSANSGHSIGSSSCGPAQIQLVPASTQERRITIMLIAVVILFLVCQIPSAAMLLYTSVHETVPNTNEHALLLAFGNIFNFLMAINAAGNFILYSFLSKKYRRTFVILFCSCLGSSGATSGSTGRLADHQRAKILHLQSSQPPAFNSSNQSRLARFGPFSRSPTTSRNDGNFAVNNKFVHGERLDTLV